jgi:hypothetical protein
VWYLLIDGQERHLFSPWHAYAGTYNYQIHKRGDDITVCRMMNDGPAKVVYRVTR